MPENKTPAETTHVMETYQWGIGGSGLRQGFKCSCGWYVSENDSHSAEDHLKMEAQIIIMNRAFEQMVNPLRKVTA